MARVYLGRDGDATKALYQRLESLGAAGTIAAYLLRASKTSMRAKEYRRSSSRHASYDTKDWALRKLTDLLAVHADELGILWGWGIDPAARNFEHVLYVEVETGQISFHVSSRGAGPNYPKPWDQVKGAGPDRAVRYAARLLEKETTAG